jgi:hypothetical protein
MPSGGSWGDRSLRTQPVRAEWRNTEVTRNYADLLKRLEDTGTSGEKGLKI